MAGGLQQSIPAERAESAAIWQQFGSDNPNVAVLDSCMKIDFASVTVLDGELLRITLENKTDTISDARLTVRLLADSKVCSESRVDVFIARWLPIKVTNAGSPMTLEFAFHDVKNDLLVESKTVKIIFVDYEKE